MSYNMTRNIILYPNIVRNISCNITRNVTSQHNIIT